MRYGMNLLLWTTQLDESIAPVLESLAELGFDGVEVPVIDTTIDYERWARRLADLGLAATAVTVRSAADNPIAADPANRAAAIAATTAALDCCAALGAERLVGPLHSALGEFSGTAPTAQEWAWSVEGLQEVAAHAASVDIPICLEALNRFECYLVNSQADAVRLVRDVDSTHCTVLYDTFHAHIEEKDVADAVHSCIDRLGHVHISENDRSTPGQGGVAWDETFAALSRGGYDGWLTIEAFGQAMPDFAAATRIWRPMFESELQLARDGLAFMKAKTAQHFA
jgi:D-psicose/D-tagatose/L-ribulose 3-epimerase